MVQQDRYCRNCGQELRPEDQFCAGCGRPVHAMAHIPTPEADVPVPPTPLPQEQQPNEAQEAPRGPVWGMLAVFLILGIGVTVQTMEPASSGEGLAFRIGTGTPYGVAATLGVAALLLLIGGVYYVTGRKDEVTFREAIFNWPLVILVGIVAFLSLL